nr:SDR family NAD(P)-dependent oxidoreductase [Pseudomonas luteola]
MLLKNKVYIIVGAASLRGIGYAVIDLFAKHGARLVAVDVQMSADLALTIQQAVNTAHSISADIMGIKCDIADRLSCQEMIEKVMEKFGRIDGLVNCAAIVQSKSIIDINESDFDRMININLKGIFNLLQACLPQLQNQGSGSIVNVASVAAQRGGGLVGGAHYAASKGGVISLTKTVAREFGQYGVRANTVCPSMTETGMIDGMTREQYEAIVSSIPLRRAGHASDIAGACLFLSSDLSAYVTGATLDVNGGSHIH